MKKTAFLLCLMTSVLSAKITAATFTKIDMPDPNSTYYTACSFLPDGRTVAYDGYEIWVESATGSGLFNSIGNVGDTGSADPAFIIPVPGANNLLLGQGIGGDNPSANGMIYSMPISGGSISPVADVDFHNAGAFRSTEELYLDSAMDATGSGSVISLLNITTGLNTNLIVNKTGASADIAIDSLGNLYGAIGYDAVTGRTGEIRKFSKSSIDNALLTGTTINFDNGTLIANELSAASMSFISEDYLLCGGGNFSTSQYNYFAVIDVSTGNTIAAYDPDSGSSWSFYDVNYNVATDEVTAALGEGYPSDWVMYKLDASTIPEPALTLVLYAAINIFLRRRK